jgi:hypothetical protein
MNRKLTIEVTPQEASAIVGSCERKGFSPLTVLLNACGYQNPQPEPFIFDIAGMIERRRFPTDKDVNEQNPLTKRHLIAGQIWQEIDNRTQMPRAHGEQNKIYLELLSQLFKWDQEKVSAKIQNRGGTRRLYFSKNDDEVLQPKPIRNSEPTWYANTKLNAELKERILYKLLSDLNFSPAYGRFVSSLVNNKRPLIAGLGFALDQVTKQI